MVLSKKTVVEENQTENGSVCPMIPGTIQCPENGLPIILGCDSQTLGGYPRILQIAATDLHLIGQLRPNDSVSFKMISIDQARKELMEQNSLFTS